MGQQPRSHSGSPRLDPILPPDLHHSPSAMCRQSEYPHDVSAIARGLALGGEFGCAARLGRVEYLGYFFGDGLLADGFVGVGLVF